jgi:hypothetical protein
MLCALYKFEHIYLHNRARIYQIRDMCRTARITL